MMKAFIFFTIMITSIGVSFSQSNFITDKSVDAFARKIILEDKAVKEKLTLNKICEKYKNQYLVFSNLLNDSLKLDNTDGLYTIKFASITEPISILIIQNKKLKCYIINKETDLKKLTNCVIDYLTVKKISNEDKVLIIKNLFIEIDNSLNVATY